ncbi:hypothetical protein SAVIM338S_04347 [Streptomyces avidinii]
MAFGLASGGRMGGGGRSWWCGAGRGAGPLHGGQPPDPRASNAGGAEFGRPPLSCAGSENPAPPAFEARGLGRSPRGSGAARAYGQGRAPGVWAQPGPTVRAGPQGFGRSPGLRVRAEPWERWKGGEGTRPRAAAHPEHHPGAGPRLRTPRAAGRGRTRAEGPGVGPGRKVRGPAGGRPRGAGRYGGASGDPGDAPGEARETPPAGAGGLGAARPVPGRPGRCQARGPGRRQGAPGGAGAAPAVSGPAWAVPGEARAVSGPARAGPAGLRPCARGVRR